MPRKEFKNYEGGELVSTETEGDAYYVRRVIAEGRAPTQYNKFALAAQDWDNDDGTPNLFAELSARERDLLYEMVLHLRANATDRAESRETLISEMAEEFEARGL
jgi:hypothetical protein